MKSLIRASVQVLIFWWTVCYVSGQDDGFQMTQIGSNNLFNGAWEIHWGPDDYLWVSERVGKKIYRVNPADGTKDLIYTFSNAVQQHGQDGLLGFDLHPDLGKGTGNDFVYASYSYIDGGAKRQKIVRLTYTISNNDGSLSNEIDLLTGLPCGIDHNSGRLIFGPDEKLYYTLGDQGFNRGSQACIPNRAQVIPTQNELNIGDYSNYVGKSLRINLDGTIPADNPTIEGVKSHVFTYGHRNAQGLVFSSQGFLYSDEHADNSDDEINLLVSGGNYGWPHVAGYRDDKLFVYCNYSADPNCSSSKFNNYQCHSDAESSTETSWDHPDFQPPLATMFTVENDYNFFGPDCPSDWICRSNVAPSSIDVYETYSDGVSGWNPSLLIVSLKRGRVYRYEIAGDGLSLGQNYTEHWNTVNRYRDIAVNPNGREFYIITDNSGGTEAADGKNVSSALANPGALLKFEYGDVPLDTDNSLSDLYFNTGVLSPTFDPNITSYTLTVSSDVIGLDAYAFATSDLATISLGSFNSIPGSDKIIVTAEDGSIREYTVTVVVQLDDDAFLKSLSVLEGDLIPAFMKEVTTYQVEVPYGTEMISVSASPNSNKSSVQIGSFNQIPGTDKITVTAENGNEKEYYIEIIELQPLQSTSFGSAEIRPNPVEKYLFLSLKNLNDRIKIELLNVSGKQCHISLTQSGSGQYSIDMGQLSSGIYFLKMIDSKGVRTKKIFKR